MSSNNQNQAMQRFFEFVFNVPGDCFCCTWSISCFLATTETVEHMEGDKRWRSICTIGMSLLSLIIVFLLTLALCPKFYWSEINQIVMFNSTTVIPHKYSSTYIPTIYLNSTALNSSLSAANAVLQAPLNDLNADSVAFNLTVHSVWHQQIGLQLNLWHIKHCMTQYINNTYYKSYLNSTSSRVFINSTCSTHNETCSLISYRESGTTSSTQDLSLWFIVLVIGLLLLGSGCVLGTHPIFDKCHHKNTALRSSIQKILAVAITVLCACILNWSSFVFAAVFENQVEKYEEWQEKEGITQSNLGTGMLAVNGAMLLGIILSVIHCGAPIRTDLNQSNVNDDNDNDNNDEDDEKTDDVNYEQRMLLRRIPVGNSGMNNMAILSNPDEWFKSNVDSVVDIHVEGDDDNDFKEFEYQNMNGIHAKDDDDSSYNANLSMNRLLIRKKDKESDSKTVRLLVSDDEIEKNDSDDELTPITKSHDA